MKSEYREKQIDEFAEQETLLLQHTARKIKLNQLKFNFLEKAQILTDVFYMKIERSMRRLNRLEPSLRAAGISAELLRHERGVEDFVPEFFDTPAPENYLTGDYMFSEGNTEFPLGFCHRYYLSYEALNLRLACCTNPLLIEYYSLLIYVRDMITRRQSEVIKLYRRSGILELSNEWSDTVPCPATNCRGFLSSGECLVCHKSFCEECNQEVTEGHLCDPDDLATATLLKRDCKPCPNPRCKQLISKIDGCEQMWCAMCHTVFDWKSMEIQTSGKIHNPEFFRYQRELANRTGQEMPREFNLCDDDEQIEMCTPPQTSQTVLHQLEMALRFTEMGQNCLNRKVHLRNTRMQLYRKSYLLKRYTEEEWRKQLWNYYNRSQILELQQTLNEVTRGALMLLTLKAKRGHLVTTKDIQDLDAFNRDQIHEINKTFKCNYTYLELVMRN